MSNFTLDNTTCTPPHEVDAFCGKSGMVGWMEWQLISAIVGLLTAPWLCEILPKDCLENVWFRLVVVLSRFAVCGTSTYATVRGFRCPTLEPSWGSVGYLVLTPVIAFVAGVYAGVKLAWDVRQAAKQRPAERAAAAEAEELKESGNTVYRYHWTVRSRQRRPSPHEQH